MVLQQGFTGGGGPGLSIDSMYLFHMLEGIRHLEENIFDKKSGVEVFKLQLEYLMSMIPNKERYKEIRTAYLENSLKLSQSAQGIANPDSVAYIAGFECLNDIICYLNLALKITKEDVFAYISDLQSDNDEEAPGVDEHGV